VLSGAYLLTASIFTMETSSRFRFYGVEEVEEHSEEGKWLVVVQRPLKLESMEQLLRSLKAFARSPTNLHAAGEIGGQACMALLHLRKLEYVFPQKDARKRERDGYTRIYPVTKLDAEMARAFGLVLLSDSDPEVRT
jgi:hypothetical protein